MQFDFSWDKLKSIAKGAAIAGLGAVAAYLAGEVSAGGAGMVAVLSIIVNAVYQVVLKASKEDAV